MRKNKAYAVWRGNLKEGKGTATIPSINRDINCTAGTRFGDEKGSNPEELIAAAHAQCFSMALAHELSQAGFQVNEVSATANVVIESKDGGFAITRSELSCEADVSGIEDDKFQQIAKAAKENCPVSKALASLEITLEARLK